MSRKGLEESNFIVTAKELSLILGVSPSRVRQLHSENALVRVSHGKYDLPASIQTYTEYLVNRNKSEEELDKTKEEALLTRARRKKAEIDLKIMEGKVHRSEDVEAVMTDMLSNFRAQLLALPSKLSPRLVGLTDVNVINACLKSEIYKALHELSEYDPDDFRPKDLEFVDDGAEVSE